MSTNLPLSIVIPTRDRSSLLANALDSLAAQSCGDFEVIIADNSTVALEPSTVQRDGLAVQLTRARDRLPMHENWEFGLSRARAPLVAVMIDKIVWLPSTVQRLLHAAEAHQAEIFSWYEEAFIPDRDGDFGGSGRYDPGQSRNTPRTLSTRQVLEQKATFATRREEEGSNYYIGKICFGAYRRVLLERIRARTGQVCPPISPDYTAMIAALALANECYDLGLPLQINTSTALSNGAQLQRDPGHAERFLRGIDIAAIDALPIRGLYASHHNLVASDYQSVLESLNETKIGVSRVDLLVRAWEDLNNFTWVDSNVQTEQYSRLETAINALEPDARDEVRGRIARQSDLQIPGSLRATIIRTIDRMPWLSTKLRRVFTRGIGAPQRCHSIGAATRIGDAHNDWYERHRRGALNS